MAGKLAILSVALSRRIRSLPDPVDGHRNIRFDVTIRVENRGDVPLQVVDELRGIDFDAVNHVLTLRLNEPPPAPVRQDAPQFHLSPPRTKEVGANEEAKIVVAIPAILTAFQPGAKGGATMQKTDIRSMRSIRCEISSSENAIEKRGKESAYELRTRLRDWGELTTIETPVEPDVRES